MNHLLKILFLCLALPTSAHDTAEALMQYVISHHQKSDYHSHDYYHYTQYESRDLSLNDIDPLNVHQKFMLRHKRFRKFVESNDLDNKFSIPLMTDERVSEKYWRKVPKREVTVVTGVKREGLNKMLDTSDILHVLIGEKYSDIDIFSDKIKIDRHAITSPLGKDALKYYAYDIEETSYAERDTIYHVSYRDIDDKGHELTGDMIIICDSVPHIKYFRVMLPHKRRFHTINNLYVTQEFDATTQGDWMLVRNDVMAELRPWGRWGKLCYIKSQRNLSFSTDTIDAKLLRGKNSLRYAPESEYRDATFWAQYDPTVVVDATSLHVNSTLIPRDPYAVTGVKVRINEILDYAKEVPGLYFPIWLIRSYVNDYIDTGSPSRFVIQPTRALISVNDIDGLRLRFGGSTTAHFNRRLFFSGYGAYGFRSQRGYYKGRVTYSFVDKKYQADEYPRRNIYFESRRDICGIGERSAKIDRDDLFRSLRWRANRNQMFYDQQRLEFERDEKCGLSFKTGISRERDRSTGNLTFGTLTTTQFHFDVEYCPSKGYYYIANSQIPVNAEAPSIGVSHSWGIKGFLGGEYTYHLTEMKIYKRWFLHGWGFAKTTLKAGAVWSRVPYPLLLSPAANLSYIIDDESFNLVSASEFVNDRYTQLMLSWETGGNFLGTIPVLRRARLKEYFGFRALWGRLTDKNNPNINTNSDLPKFPSGFYIMNDRIPYIEGIIGIHNIFQILNIDYIHRFTYLNQPNVKSSGVRFSLKFAL